MILKKRTEKRILLIRTIAVLIAAAFIVLLSGCAEIKITHPLGKDKLLEINDVSCSMGTALARMLEAKTEYENAEDRDRKSVV